LRPNILFITCDQWRGDSLSATGHPSVRTPHVDALARDGVLFSRHYAAAAPCSPARACIYTGLYQMNNRVCRNGTPLDARHDTIALAARRAGYTPTLFGYTDTSPDPRGLDPADPSLRTYEGVLPGFVPRVLLPEHQKPWLSWLSARGIDASAGFPDIHRPRARGAEVSTSPPVYGSDATPAAFIAGEFVRWLGEQEAADPWFAHLSFISPHPPFIVPEPFNTMYDAGDGPPLRRAASLEAEAAIHPLAAWGLDKLKKNKFLPGARGKVRDWSEDQVRQIRAIYWGMISEVDTQLGRIFAAVGERGGWDDTIVVFMSDHAEMMGDHFSMGKGGFFDQSYHVPLVIRDPRRPKGRGRRVEAFTEAVDVMPTLLDLIGAPVPSHLDGASLLPFLDGSEPRRWRDAAHWEFDFRSVVEGEAERHFGLSSRQCNLAVLRTERWKYVHFGGLPPVLFDLANDPHETRNLASDAGYRAERLDMAERLLAWRAEHLDQSLALLELTEGGVRGQPLRL
jgi:arylsulfatase A-like enzyme